MYLHNNIYCVIVYTFICNYLLNNTFNMLKNSTAYHCEQSDSKILLKNLLFHLKSRF